ncbi:MAG: hypothetical protein ACO1OQ_10415 [Rufibacter sp.]
MDRKELRKVNGDLYFEAFRVANRPYIYVSWVGIQSLETIVMGGNLILAMLQEKPVKGLINSNKELIGPWEEGIGYLVNKWTPAAKALGLRYFAHLLSPGIFGQKSFNQFRERVQGQLQVKSFEDKDMAEDWLMLYLG